MTGKLSVKAGVLNVQQCLFVELIVESCLCTGKKLGTFFCSDIFNLKTYLIDIKSLAVQQSIDLPDSTLKVECISYDDKIHIWNASN